MLQPKDRKEFNNQEIENEPPVYKVIADPLGHKDFPVGETIRLHRWRSSHYWCYTVKDCQGEREYLSDYFDKYPHIFMRIDPYRTAPKEQPQPEGKIDSKMRLIVGRLEISCFDENSEMGIRIGNGRWESFTVNEARKVANFIQSHIIHEEKANPKKP